MTTVLNPLAYNDIGTPVYYWLPLGTRNRIHYHTFLVEMQKAAIREDPGSFREEKREGRNRLSKNPQSGKIWEVSGQRIGKRCEHCKSRFCSVSIHFPSTRFPQSGMSQFHGQKWPHGKSQMTFLAREAQVPIFQGEKPCWRNRGSSSVSPARFSLCFQGHQKPAVQEDPGSIREEKREEM